MGSWFEIFEISCIDGIVWKFRISVVKTFWAGFHVLLEVFFFGSLPSMGWILFTGRSHTRFCGDWKCYGINILGTGGIRPGFVDVCWYRLLGGGIEHLGLFVVRSTRIVSNNLAIGAEQLRDRYFFFFVSDKADGYFVSSSLEWGYKVFIGWRYSETGVWR